MDGNKGAEVEEDAANDSGDEEPAQGMQLLEATALDNTDPGADVDVIDPNAPT